MLKALGSNKYPRLAGPFDRGQRCELVTDPLKDMRLIRALPPVKIPAPLLGYLLLPNAFKVTGQRY